MTSDYNNEEIRESSFPADLKNEPDPIDMYGVWVKSGPHDSESVHPIPEKTENDAASAAADPLPEETFFQEPADIEDIEPEKTFTDNPTADIDTDISFMQEELPPEDISATAETEYSENDLKLDDIAFDDIDAVFTEDNQNGFDSAGDDIADDIETEKLKAETPEPEYPDISDNFESDIIKEEIIQDTDINPLEESYQPQSTKNKAPAVFEFEDIDFDEITSDSDGFINESEQEFLTSEGNSDNGPDEIEFENIRFSDIDGTEDTIISDISEPQDTMIPETTDEKTAAAGTEEENLIQQIGLDEEIDINSFLSDFESEKPSSDNTEKTADVSDSMDLDLDEFIDTFNKSGEIDNSREKDDLFDETEPINLDLEFDEEYIAETEKLRSAGAGSAHSEFFDSEFGVEFVDETGGEEKRDKTPAVSETRQEVTVSGLDDFDAMFASIQDESQNIEPAADNIDSVSASIPETEPVFQEEVSDSSGIDATDSYETTEFDDFLSELDNTPSQAVSQNSTEEKTEDKYNLTVTEDVSETSASSQSQILEEENFSVSLFDGDNPSLYEEDKTDSLGNTAGLASLHSEDEENEIDKILADIDFDDAANGETPQDETAESTGETIPEDFITEPETTEPVMEEVSFDDLQIDEAANGEVPSDGTAESTGETIPEDFITEPEMTEPVMEEVSFDDLQIDDASSGETPQEETTTFTEEPLPENFTTEPETTEPVMEEVSFDDFQIDEAANGEAPSDETAESTGETIPEDFITEPETTEPVMEEVSFDDLQIDDASSGETPQEETTTFTEEPLPENFTTEPETTEPVMEEVSFDDLQIDEAANGETPQEEFSDGPDKKPIDFLENEGYTGGDSNSKDITFDDLEALENDLRSDNLPEDLCAEKDENNGEEMNDKANEILLTIAEELSSIKKEISSLKMDVIQRHQERSSDIPPQQTEASSSSGFFSDDDTDETIALTGDELNNILITADFTEEEVDSGKENTAETEEAASEIPESDNSSELVSMLQEPEEAEEVKGTDIFDLSDEVENNTEDFQKTSLEDFLNVDSDISIPTDEDAENSGIDMDFPNIGGSNVEISHITSLDDETGYLSGSGEVEPDFDDVIMEEPGLESIDFEKEQLQEPELNDFSMNIEDFNKEVESEEDFGGLNLEGLAEDSQNQEENSDLDLTEDLLNDSLEEDGLSVAQEDAVPADTDEIEIPAEPAETVIEPVQENEVQKQDEVPAHISVDTTGSGSSASAINTLPSDLKEEIKSVLSYMDQLLENLPEEKIEEFARSEHFEVYKKLFADLGIS